ncbi:MAG: chromosome segregation protein ScpA [Desulfobacterales bacterium C00003060]|nr:MAG: chromosome segregation protein ScpA [Desulfobacterales bacterium S3730MH5]OEU80961.1 MAG: chromosome segregation protein ScpA [Desulfobacterales bacterium C00003060]
MEQKQDQAPYHVHLEDLFDGPMDLLVHLVKKNELDIHDIPIALITQQYMEYLQWLKSLNIDIAGDFIVMAATLAHIKSRMLLPTPGQEDDPEDPRMEIVRPLAEYLQLKYAAEQLTERDLLDRDVFLRRDIDNAEAWSKGEPGALIQIGLFELIDAFQQIIKKVSQECFWDLTPDTISVKSRISQIMDILEDRGSVTFQELFEAQVTRKDIIVTFLAILEMARCQVIRIMQHVESGIIRIING